MKVSELKFLLKLLGFPNYRAPLSQLQPGEKTSVLDRERVCRDLANRELIAYTSEIKKFKISAPGKAALKLEADTLPLTELELAILQASKAGVITPAQTGLPVEKRQALIQGLADRGLIKVTEDLIKEVWLTDRGQVYLRDECNPNGTAAISLNLLHNYIRFLRKSFYIQSGSEQVASPLPSSDGTASLVSAAQVLSLIQALDHELGTDNYLPIFHLRQKIQPSLSRDELDQILYQLQRSDQIELSVLQETIAYTPDQIEAGIPQEIGGPLFFITVS